MFNYSTRGWVNIQNGTSNGRSISESLREGRIVVRGVDAKGREFERVVVVKDGEILDSALRRDGRLVRRIVYGRFESVLTPQGREVTRFAKGTGKGRHGLAVRFASLFGSPGKVQSWYKQGRLVRQRFVFAGGKVGYDWKGRSAVCVVRDAAGAERWRVRGQVNGNEMWDGKVVFDRPQAEWFLRGTPFMAWKGEREWFGGEYVRGQRQGRWVEGGRVRHFEHGVEVPKVWRRLWEQPAAEVNPVEVLRVPNAQLRMALLARLGPQQLAKAGRLIHRDGEMRLWSVPGMETRILRVQCPSTKSFYFIRVPRDSRTCEEARQWTFHVGAGIRAAAGKIEFAQET